MAPANKPSTPATANIIPGGPTLEDLLKSEDYKHPPLEALLPPDPESRLPEHQLQLSLFPSLNEGVEQVLDLMETLNFTEKQLADLLFNIPLTDSEGIINKRLAFEFSQLPSTFVAQLQTFTALVVSYARIHQKG